MESSKKILLSTIFIAILIILASGITFAFFNYTRTGLANSIRVGRISFNTSQNGNINLVNVFPISSSEATGENPNYDEVVIEIEGDTDYSGGIEYLVSAVDANIYTEEGQVVPICLDIKIDDNLGTENNNYFTARDNTNTSIYKKIVGNTLVGDGMLLVGYIAPNSSGNIDGIDGTITIKAYLDKNKILISDTYDGTELDNMGTTNNEAEGKTVITTSEWNALQQNGVSFKVKVEANEGIWVVGSLEEIMKKDAVMDNISSKFVSSQTGINFGVTASNNNGNGVYMRAGTENDDYPIMYYRGDVKNNNVVFANKCWKAVRTTDTGGIKLVYNGEYGNNYVNVENILLSMYENVEITNQIVDPRSKFTFDSTDNSWNANMDNSHTIVLPFSVKTAGDYTVEITGPTVPYDTHITYYKNNSLVASSSVYSGSVLYGTYSYSSISPSDVIRIYMYMSSTDTIPVKIRFLNNGVALTYDEYVFDSYGFTYDELTREWTTSTNDKDSSTIKFNFNTPGYYALKYTLPGGTDGKELIKVKKNGNVIPLPYGQNITVNLGYVETNEQLNITISNEAHGDYFKNRFAIIKQDTAGVGCNNSGYESVISGEENSIQKSEFSV